MQNHSGGDADTSDSVVLGMVSLFSHFLDLSPHQCLFRYSSVLLLNKSNQPTNAFPTVYYYLLSE